MQAIGADQRQVVVERLMDVDERHTLRRCQQPNLIVEAGHETPRQRPESGGILGRNRREKHAHAAALRIADHPSKTADDRRKDPRISIGEIVGAFHQQHGAVLPRRREADEPRKRRGTGDRFEWFAGV